MTDITDATFDTEVLAAKLPVLVDFWTHPCPPCATVAPWLAQLALELGDGVKIVKARLENNARAVKTFKVRGAPTFLVFQDGVVVARQPGLSERPRFFDWVRHAVSDAPLGARQFEWIAEPG